MTDQEIIDEVKDEVGNVSIDTKILRWVNSFLYRLTSKLVFPHLRLASSFPTVISQQEYSLAADLFYVRGIWSINNKLDPESELTLIDNDSLWNTQTGTVMKYVLLGNKVLLYKVPAAVETIYYSYQKRPTAIVLGKTTEYADYPIEWHSVLAQGAIVKGFKYEDNAKYTDARAELKEMIKELRGTVNRRPDVRHVLKSSNSVSRRPMGPAMLDPSQYERP